MENRSASDTPATKALAMLSAFASVSARAFNLTLTNIEQEKVEGSYRPNTPLEQLRRTIIGRILQDAEKFRHNVIIRPRSSTATLIQLDDLDFARAERIAPHSIIVFRTSPANYQACVAVEKDAPEDFGRRLRKGAGADATASGSTRIAGSRNFKAKYGPDSEMARSVGSPYPTVEIIHTNSGKVTSAAVLERAGLVADREEPKPPRPAYTRPMAPSGRPSRKKVLSYEMCLRGAPKAHGEDRPDISKVDFLFARTAAEWGWKVPDIAGFLMQYSEKARPDGECASKRIAVARYAARG